MTDEERRRLRELARKSFTGGHLSPEEFNFCDALWEKHPDEYAKVYAAVKEEEVRNLNPLYGKKLGEDSGDAHK